MLLPSQSSPSISKLKSYDHHHLTPHSVPHHIRIPPTLPSHDPPPCYNITHYPHYCSSPPLSFPPGHHHHTLPPPPPCCTQLPDEPLQLDVELPHVPINLPAQHHVQSPLHNASRRQHPQV